ncbi:MAG: hypothetical protein AB7I52_04045 [Rhizobiaceae bacterium]
MRKAVLAILVSVSLAFPAFAQKGREKAMAEARTQLVDFLAEAIAIDSVCPMLKLHTEYIWVMLSQVKVNLDELLPEAGAKSSSYMDHFAQLGVGPVCQLGSDYYGPQGSKAPNMLMLDPAASRS